MLFELNAIQIVYDCLAPFPNLCPISYCRAPLPDDRPRLTLPAPVLSLRLTLPPPGVSACPPSAGVRGSGERRVAVPGSQSAQLAPRATRSVQPGQRGGLAEGGAAAAAGAPGRRRAARLRRSVERDAPPASAGRQSAAATRSRSRALPVCLSVRLSLCLSVCGGRTDGRGTGRCVFAARAAC